MNTEIVQQVSKDQYLKDAERVVLLSEMLWNCSCWIEVQKSFIRTGDSLFKSTHEATLKLEKYERIYHYIQKRLLRILLNMATQL